MKSENAFPESKWEVLSIRKKIKIKVTIRKFVSGLVSESAENGKEIKW